jgi:4'-phosphopantetheinyl transferase
LAWSRITLVAGRAPVALAVQDDPSAVGTRQLSADERRTCAQLGPRRGMEFVRGRVLLRRLVEAVLGLPYQQISVLVAEGGAIRLADHHAGVSISHTSRYTAAAVWPDGRVGVDVEEPPAGLDNRLVRRCCQGWSDQVNRLPDAARAAAFARVWTVQEACVKAVGLGLAGAPWRIPVHPEATRGHWGTVHWSSHDAWTPALLAVAGQPY